jgi:hypothetical protein
VTSFAWSRQNREPRRSVPATGLPFVSAIELVDVIWHLFPARGLPEQVAMACQLSAVEDGEGRLAHYDLRAASSTI